MTNLPDSVNVTVVGGGLVGLATAEALAQQGFSVLLLEAQPPKLAAESSYDDRTLVVGAASRNFWQNLGVWPTVAEEAVAIKSVHVSQRGHFGSAVFTAHELGAAALGHVVEARQLGLALQRQVSANPRVHYLNPARFAGFTKQAENAPVNVRYSVAGQPEVTTTCDLLVAADGARSPIRQQLAVPVETHNYGKTAVICTISTAVPHQGRAFERLTADGPVAVLPFRDGRCGFVWSMPTDQAEAMLSANDTAFRQAAQQRFGTRLGRFTRVGRRSSYPLYRITVPRQVADGVVLMGNAAHTVSPVSAQGLNLAVRDVAQLVETLVAARHNELALGSLSVLQQYQTARQEDQTATLRYTDDLMRWFAIERFPVDALRSAALLTAGISVPLQARLFRHGSGFRGHVPNLLRPAP